jgi:Flp pilus assembly pilin Flp
MSGKTNEMQRVYTMKLFTKFKNDESGAVTVDWVVLTAGVVLLAAVAVNAVKGQLATISGVVSTAITDINTGS